jgi:hypothetical protein
MKRNFIYKLKKYPKHGIGKARGSAIERLKELGQEGIGGAVNSQIQALAEQMAEQMVAQQTAATTISNMGKTFSVFNQAEDIVKNQTELVTAGLWSDNQGTLTTHFSSSTETLDQIRHYVDVYQKDPSATGSAVQYALAYGNALGSGSSELGSLANPASKATYGQYKQLLLEKTATRFVTAGSGSTDSIYVVNIQRNRMKEQLDAGNWELPLTTIGSRASNATGSVTLTAGTYTLIDDSSVNVGTNGESGIVYNIVSGSIDDGIYNTADPVYYGLFYPLHGALVLDGKMLDQQLAFDTNTSSDSEGNNHYALFHSISGSGAFGFDARNQETVTSTNYFVRIKNGMFNFSNNPSYTTGSVGQFAQSTFVGAPISYITTVGLYNNKQELLAVAKLSKPLLKSFSREALVKVKLDF